MAVVELGVLAIALGLIVSIAVVLFVIALVYIHLNRKFKHKFEEFASKEFEIYENLRKINEARANEGKELKKRLETIEDKLDIAIKPDGEEKELAKEKVKAKSK